MGTTWSVRFHAAPNAPAVTTLRPEIERRLDAIDATMSTWRSDSELTKFNTAPPGTRMTFSPELAYVTAAAIDLAHDTDGAYDPTVGPLVDLWGFGPTQTRGTAPDPNAIAAARRQVGWQRIAFAAATGSALQPGDAHLDLSSIAKGYAVDQIGEVLHRHGIDDFVIDIGGEVLARGGRTDGSRWRVAIERPAPGERTVLVTIEPGDQAVATSGTYRNALLDSGHSFSHLIDPRTGYPIAHDLVSVSVVDRSCMRADALATALSILGPDGARAYAEAHGLAVLLIRRDGDALTSYETPEFRVLRD
ncbi:MAG: FAD:protein FMN transferase [Gammaproteobacteria bacterium]|nr:FAD:protein FMN transferase [Gammaproteobacteria bacterium]